MSHPDPGREFLRHTIATLAYRGGKSVPRSWGHEVERFFEGLRKLDEWLASDARLGFPAERVFQGPVADALTHIGQIAMLRRLAGTPVRGENYFKAEIKAGRVGAEQASPVREFE